jgi:hypothetical protein
MSVPPFRDLSRLVALRPIAVITLRCHPVLMKFAVKGQKLGTRLEASVG